MRKILLRLVFLASALLAAGCHNDGFDQVWLKEESLCVVSGTQKVFSYDPLTCQQAFNRSTRTFRAFTDDMSDYYVLTMGSLPSEAGEKIGGCSLEWTTADDVKTLKGLTFAVEKIETGTGKVWLWCSSEGLVVIAQLL
ncbi:MAG: hypothetical protein J6Y27_08445 [Bacteroidales bacterium]|nr:hypothetical protein [Bacteroidales bacterium]MBP5390349.1 hypothetical protein [Bacteroidales bacterium]MBP5635544.1 hypothetical protein [Bacteroidales bacterium]